MSKSVLPYQETNPAAQGERLHRPQAKAQSMPGQQHGVLVLDKPRGLSSAACIARIKRVLGQKKIGHAGTLDPMAEGVLLVLLGQATKISGHLMSAGEKVYSGIIRLGTVTDTWDAEGQTLEERPVPADIDDKRIALEMAGLTGTYEQEVPAYSAAKHQGKALYKLARKGVETPVKIKVVTISRSEAELVGPGRVHFRVRCGSGTYIRSLAHSLGKRLGCGACLEKLIREYSHPFGLDLACGLEAVLNDPEGFAARVRGFDEALPEWPRLRLTEAQAAAVRNGASLDCAPGSFTGTAPFAEGMRALMLAPQAEPLALAETARDKDGRPVWAVVRGLWNS